MSNTAIQVLQSEHVRLGKRQESVYRLEQAPMTRAQAPLPVGCVESSHAAAPVGLLGRTETRLRQVLRFQILRLIVTSGLAYSSLSGQTRPGAVTGAEKLARERVHVLVRALNFHALFANDTLHVDACSVQRATKPGAEGFVRGEPYLQDRMSGLCRDASVPPTCARIICVDSIIVATKGITRVHLTVNRGSVQYREEHEFIRAYGGFDWVRVVLRQPIVND